MGCGHSKGKKNASELPNAPGKSSQLTPTDQPFNQRFGDENNDSNDNHQKDSDPHPSGNHQSGNSAIYPDSPLASTQEKLPQQDFENTKESANTEQPNNYHQRKIQLNVQPSFEFAIFPTKQTPIQPILPKIQTKQNSKTELLTLRDQIQDIQTQLASIKDKIIQFNDSLNQQDSTTTQSLNSLRTDLHDSLRFLYECTQKSTDADFDSTYSKFGTNINSTSNTLNNFTTKFNEDAHSNHSGLQGIQTQIKSLNDSFSNTIDTVNNLIQDSNLPHADFNDSLPDPQIELHLKFEDLSTYTSGIKRYFESARTSFSTVSGAKREAEAALAQQESLKKQVEELEKTNQNLETKIQGQDLIIHHQSQLYQNMYQELFENISPNPTST